MAHRCHSRSHLLAPSSVCLLLLLSPSLSPSLFSVNLFSTLLAVARVLALEFFLSLSVSLSLHYPFSLSRSFPLCHSLCLSLSLPLRTLFLSDSLASFLSLSLSLSVFLSFFLSRSRSLFFSSLSLCASLSLADALYISGFAQVSLGIVLESCAVGKGKFSPLGCCL